MMNKTDNIKLPDNSFFPENVELIGPPVKSPEEILLDMGVGDHLIFLKDREMTIREALSQKMIYVDIVDSEFIIIPTLNSVKFDCIIEL